MWDNEMVFLLFNVCNQLFIHSSFSSKITFLISVVSKSFVEKSGVIFGEWCNVKIFFILVYDCLIDLVWSIKNEFSELVFIVERVKCDMIVVEDNCPESFEWLLSRLHVI
jgi:hypothetical protein